MKSNANEKLDQIKINLKVHNLGMRHGSLPPPLTKTSEIGSSYPENVAQNKSALTFNKQSKDKNSKFKEFFVKNSDYMP